MSHHYSHFMTLKVTGLLERDVSVLTCRLATDFLVSSCSNTSFGGRDEGAEREAPARATGVPSTGTTASAADELIDSFAATCTSGCRQRIWLTHHLTVALYH